MVNELKFSVLMFGVAQAIKLTAWKHASYREHLKQQDCAVQIKLKDNSRGRVFRFTGGQVSSRGGVHAPADASVIFKDAETAVRFMSLPVNHAARVHAAKNLLVAVEGPDELVSWFM